MYIPNQSAMWRQEQKQISMDKQIRHSKHSFIQNGCQECKSRTLYSSFAFM